MASGSNYQFTEIPTDYVVDQVYTYQDVNELKNSVMRLEAALSDQHAWDKGSNDAEWSGKYTDPSAGPAYNLGAHVGNIGLDGLTTYYGSGEHMTNTEKMASLITVPRTAETAYSTYDYNYHYGAFAGKTYANSTITIATWLRMRETTIANCYFKEPTSTGTFTYPYIYVNQMALRLRGTFTLHVKCGLFSYLEHGSSATPSSVSFQCRLTGINSSNVYGATDTSYVMTNDYVNREEFVIQMEQSYTDVVDDVYLLDFYMKASNNRSNGAALLGLDMGGMETQPYLTNQITGFASESPNWTAPTAVHPGSQVLVWVE